MAIRTGLVGLVAALSLTLPSGKQIEVWKQQAQSWMNARMAEWDARMPAGEDAFVYISEPIAPQRIVSEPTPTPAPVLNSQGEAVAANAKVTEKTEAPRSVPSKPTDEETIAALADAASAPAIPTEPMPLEGREIAIASEVVPTPTPLPLASPSAQDAAFFAALDETLAAFAADLNRPAPTAAPAIIAAESEDEVPGAFDEPEVDLVFEHNRSTEGLCVLNTPMPRPIAPPVVAVVVESTEPGDEFDPIVVFGWDHEFEESFGAPAIATVAEVPVTSAASLTAPAATLTAPAVDPLARAVRLTREAVFAWASVLGGPAVVTTTTAH